MPVKPTKGGGARAKVDTSTSPTRPDDMDISLPGPSGRGGSGSAFSADNLQSWAGSSAIDADATRATASVVVHAIRAQASLPAPQPTLDHYVINAHAMLPAINSEGLRVLDQRTYVDVAGGDLVLVAVDPQTGLHRARRPSELLPGPVMLRDADSGLWYARDVAEPTTREQIRKYLPDTTDEDADAFIARFDDKDVAELELKHIQRGLALLDLTHLDMPFSPVRITSSDDFHEAWNMWTTLRQLYKWQGQPDQRVYSDGRFVGFKLDINLTTWPVEKPLSLKFSSVVSLTLRGGGPLRLDPHVFCAQFPNLESLKITSQVIQVRGQSHGWDVTESVHSKLNIDLRFSEQLKSFQRLRELSLQDCELAPGFSVRGLTRLQLLRLGHAQEVAVSNLYLQMLHRQQVERLQVAADVTDMTQLRVLDLSHAGIHLLPPGLDAIDVASKLEVLRLGGNPLANSPSLKNMTALQELDLSNTRLQRFPEGITDRIPAKELNLANNHIRSIPESVELRAGFNLVGNPMTDPASLRRLIRARVETGTDIWLGQESSDVTADLWLRNVPQEQIAEKRALWNRHAAATPQALTMIIRRLSRTPEFHVERPLLQRRVWWFLDMYDKADVNERARLDAILSTETSPGRMLDRLEEEIRQYDGGRQNQPSHPPPKRPRLE
ncbi:leucine-rich repeat domain-containing protein [Pseudomonas moraviensis]|uniref:leucine-rich repeat domain-containing protein n=1 Tax=Pseudomonas moraviensis TaxID=321662 RepID=UPI0020C2F123|nr:leucine-rich repeat domain-containing protein [Pseudomonas moraviensis]